MTLTVDRLPGVVRIANSHATVEVATGFGPRVMSYSLGDSPNVFVHLPDSTLDWRPGRPFLMHGGHRLWVAPEVPDLTYAPDDAPVAVDEGPAAVTFAGSASAETPFAKSITVELDSVTAAVTVVHRVRNDGEAAALAAPWAISMLRPEGTVLLPLAPRNSGEVQANRSIVLWPYTRLDDPGIAIDDEAIVVRGDRAEPTKIGIDGSVGWGAYLVDGMVFTKHASYQTGATYPDLGAAVQCYAKNDFCELETLGPLSTIEPGNTVEHVERWTLERVADLDPSSPLAGLVHRRRL